jgi:hypothetical protein
MSQTDEKNRIIKLVEDELNSLKPTLIRYMEYIPDEDIPILDPRLALKHILISLVDAHGGETPHSICDTLPREMIGYQILKDYEATNNYKLLVANVEQHISDYYDEYSELSDLKEKDYNKYKKKFNDWEYFIDQYARHHKIIPTRQIEEKTVQQVADAVVKFVSQHFTGKTASKITLEQYEKLVKDHIRGDAVA